MINLKNQLLFAIATSCLVFSCKNNTEKKEVDAVKSTSLSGTYKLIESKTIKGKDTVTVFTDTSKTEMFKMFNDDHFSFFNHDKEKGKGKEPLFVAGGGTYSFDGVNYQERLQYCSMRDWESNKFDFKLTLKGDTLIQTGEENLPELGVKHTIVETYLKVK
ncbi:MULTISPECIES: hypothetical protein [Sphingobacterium]|uniref:Lipocalin-like domain-containing protein n=1 Tax=Sphingobacterium multivorum TaxID=28454 RepID=A0A2X2IXW6_SPHMU|nr:MULTISPECIES: hypothetical protein [Sphingobacterium]OFV12056.1 hypothetical protein HMPREF3127_17690 [Sphingobacterium sp. HMSC13C05]QRQ59685.1 hypothetical protein I6J33_16055 [Sphingobacterium multivorum]SPZ85001.1 Uncharacterised protein [Sphingobacterium multivorum]